MTKQECILQAASAAKDAARAMNTLVGKLDELAKIINVCDDLKQGNFETVYDLPAAETPQPPAEKQQETDTVDYATLRTLCADVLRSGKKDELRALLMQYGSPKLSKIPEAHYAALYKDVKTLHAAT